MNGDQTSELVCWHINTAQTKCRLVKCRCTHIKIYCISPANDVGLQEETMCVLKVVISHYFISC